MAIKWKRYEAEDILFFGGKFLNKEQKVKY